MAWPWLREERQRCSSHVGAAAARRRCLLHLLLQSSLFCILSYSGGIHGWGIRDSDHGDWLSRLQPPLACTPPRCAQKLPDIVNAVVKLNDGDVDSVLI